MKFPRRWLVALLLAVYGTTAGAVNLPDEVLLNGVELVRIPAGEFFYSVEIDYPNRRKY